MRLKVSYGFFLPALFLLFCAAASPTSRAAPPPTIAAPFQQDDMKGGGKPDKGHLSLNVMPDKVFNGETFTLTAQLRAPKDKDGHPKSVTGISIGFNRVSTTLQNPTNSSGTAMVEWTADINAAADDDGNVLLTAQVDTAHRNDYDKDDPIPNEPPAADRRGRDHQTVKVLGGKVLLNAETDDVKIGEPANLTARIRAGSEESIEGKTIKITSYIYDSSEDEWQKLLNHDGVTWSYTDDTDEDGEIHFTTPNLSGGQYRFVAYYNANGDDDDDNYVEDPDPGEVDKEFITPGFTLKKIVLYGFGINKTRAVGEDRFIYKSDGTGGASFLAEVDPNSSEIRALADHFKWTLKDTKHPDPYLDWGRPGSGHTGSELGKYAEGIGSPSNYINFLLKHLPEDNSGFGKHDLTVQVIGYGKTKTKSVRLFFYPTGQDHPKSSGDPTTANWYYYWSQEGAGEGGQSVCAFSRNPKHENYAAWSAPPEEFPNAYGYEGSNTIYICDNAAAQVHGWPDGDDPYEFPEGDDAPSDWIHFSIKVHTAPDFVNLTYAHEATHRVLENINFDSSGLADKDMDGVPDMWESVVPGMRHMTPATDEDPKDTDSFGSHFTISHGSHATRDEEFYCTLGGALSTDSGNVSQNPLTGPYRGVKPEKAKNDNDWSVDGKNWKGTP